MPACAITDWAAFWQSVTPRQQWDALLSAPKIAGPMTTPDYEGVRRRHNIAGRVVAVYWPDGDCDLFASQKTPGGNYVTHAAADVALRANGWVLVDDIIAIGDSDKACAINAHARHVAREEFAKMMAEREKVSGNVSPRPEVPKETGADSDDRRPWIAGAIGKSPHDDALVWRDDAMHGPKFWAATPGDATEAARLLNDLESLAECPPVASDEIAALMADVARLTTELGEARRSLDAIQRATEHPQKDPTP